MPDTSLKLKIHSIESFGTHDGPGIRLVVFLQGCNLKCLYCHNPDTIPLQEGTEYEIETLVKRAVNMKPYFGKFGGVTVSGGEPLLQSKALIPFFASLQQKGIHTNIDTNGSVLNQSSIKLMDDYADLLMIDIKHTTEEGYHQLTSGKGIDTVLKLVQHREGSKKPFWLRYVLIPGYTDSMEQLKTLAETFTHFQYCEKIEIQPYHHLGIHKWEALGELYQLKDVKENSAEQIAKVKKLLTPYFKEVKIN